MTIEELQREIKTLQAEIAADKKRLIVPKEKRVEELKLQLLAEKLEALFQLFPEKRIAVDDPILITEEFNQLMERRGTWGATLHSVGKIHWIYDLKTVKVLNGRSTVSIPFDLALRMRQAYLAQEK